MAEVMHEISRPANVGPSPNQFRIIRNVNQKPEVKYPVTVKFDSVNYALSGSRIHASWA